MTLLIVMITSSAALLAAAVNVFVQLKLREEVAFLEELLEEKASSKKTNKLPRPRKKR